MLMLGLYACSGPSGMPSPSNQMGKDSLSGTNQARVHASSDSMKWRMDELTPIYTQAIGEFINAAYKNTKTTFDTLYIGKRRNGQADDFPDIELPSEIKETALKLVSSEEAEKLQQEKVDRVYLNLMGYVERESAEFIFVVFSNGFSHQYDYFLTFSKNLSSNKFEVDKIEFEDYRQYDGKKPKRITLYIGEE